MRQTAIAALVALAVVSAGCAGGAGSGDGLTTDPGTSAPDSGSVGTVQFYVSDERNAIDQFEHLNVTITEVGFETAGDADESSDEVETESADDTETGTANGTETVTETTTVEDTENETTTVEETTSVNGTETTTVTETETTSVNGTETTTVEETTTVDETATVTVTPDETTAENETKTSTTEAANGTETEPSETERDEERSDWVVRDVEDVTVDLTRLQGANASLVDAVDVPAGNYTTVFAHVDDVEGTLTTGEQVNVKLPSEKLQVHTPFAVGPDTDVDFVFDITVFEAGKSGKYILKPVVSQSGTDVPIEAEDRGDDDRGEAEDRDDRADAERPETEDGDDAAESIAVDLRGPVRAGQNVTVTASAGGDPVANATVVVNDATVGTTDADGTLVVTVPDAEELEVAVSAGDREGELERDVTRSGPGGESTAEA